MNVLKCNGKGDPCLHCDELDLLGELRAFLKPFETYTDLVGTPTLSLSLIPLIKLQLKKTCTPSSMDSESMKSVKTSILNKLDSRLPESNAVGIHQLLDPATKNLIPSDVAVGLLRDAVYRLTQKGFIVIQRPEPAEDSASPALKRRKLKQEMLNESQRSAAVDASLADDTEDMALG